LEVTTDGENEITGQTEITEQAEIFLRKFSLFRFSSPFRNLYAVSNPEKSIGDKFT